MKNGRSDPGRTLFLRSDERENAPFVAGRASALLRNPVANQNYESLRPLLKAPAVRKADSPGLS